MQLQVLGVGPQRTATTWLYQCLLEHPQLCFPRGVKETLFLDKRFDKGWPWYWTHFQHCQAEQLCAEIASTYFDIPEVPKRLHEHNPDCRIIVTLRDAAARSFSLYLHHCKRGRLNGSFHEAIQKMPRIIDASRYRRHLSRWIERFGREQILVLLQDDIAADPEHVLEQVYEFAGIEQISIPRSARERVNAASLPSSRTLAKLATRGGEWLRERRFYWPIEFVKKLGLKRIYKGSLKEPLPVLDSHIRKELLGEFDADIAYIEELLGRPLPGWRQL